HFIMSERSHSDRDYRSPTHEEVDHHHRNEIRRNDRDKGQVVRSRIAKDSDLEQLTRGNVDRHQSNNTQQTEKIAPEKMNCILKSEEEKLVNYDCLACLLCKRTFKSKELLTKHRNLSELHKASMNQLKGTLFTKEQIDDAERKEHEASYRDRAKERRQKYGIAEIDNPLKDKYLSAGPSKLDTIIVPSASAERPIESNSVGAKLLSKMGWKEGLGIGKSNQGMTDIIKVEARSKNAGLGTKKPRLDPNISYKDAFFMVFIMPGDEESTWMPKMETLSDVFSSACSVAVIFGGLVPYIPRAFTFVASLVTYLALDGRMFVETLGFTAVLIESMLGLPQLIRNYKKSSTKGMSVEMVAMWLSGDLFKTTYFIVRKTPPQFWICGTIQVLIDIIIICQVFWFRAPTGTYQKLPKIY
ncbi:RNA-binding protein 5, partial [Fragariocoptes setiger]